MATGDLQKVTCLLDGRSFIKFSTFQTHVRTVHGDAALLIAQFDLEDQGSRVEVPMYILEEGAGGSDVEHEKDACDLCLANGSATYLPVHAKCACAPSGGWEAYIDSLVQPDTVTDEQWSQYLTYLRRHARGSSS